MKRMVLTPFDWFSLVGEWSAQIVTIALPRSAVEQMIAHEPFLGPELELIPQCLTPAGTHPVLFTFGTHYRARMTWPNVFPPPMTYDEMVVMVPFVTRRRRGTRGAAPAPRVHMPRLFLSSYLPTLGGRFYWGFNKTMARINYAEHDTEYPHSYEVGSLSFGSPLVSLRWKVDSDASYQPVLRVLYFQAMRELHEQSLLGQMPGTAGPCLVYAPWLKFWSMGTVRRISAEMRILAPFAFGLDLGRYACAPLSDMNVLGAYQLRVPWALLLPRLESPS